MIPKIIHYCWFGGHPLPELAQRCIASWKEYCPDYEIKEWNEANFDIKCCDFVREAYEAKQWAFVSDFARLKIVYEEGGIYLDTDVEIIKSFDNLLNDKCFLGTETTGFVATGLGFGAEKGNPIIREMTEVYIGKHFRLKDNSFDMEPCPQKNTEPLYKYGYKIEQSGIWKNENAVVYPSEFFDPLDYATGECNITDKTYSIHLYNASWHTKEENLILNVRKKLKNLLGKRVGDRLALMICIPIRLLNKIRTKGISGTLGAIHKKLKK